MPSRRSLRRPEPRFSAASAATPAALIGTWHDGTLHLWGWDGARTMPPSWVSRMVAASRWPGDPLQSGHVSMIDVQLPSGPQLRPATIRLPPTATAPWLRLAARDVLPSDSLDWLRAVAQLATSTVNSGRVSPVARSERERLVARWAPVTDTNVDRALEALAAAMPPIVQPAANARDAVDEIHAVLGDSVARHRLADQRWAPDVPRRRSPAADATRAVFRALASPDPLVGPADADAVDALAIRLARRHRRASGQPVVVPRLRLDVPDELDDPWLVQIELCDELDAGRWCAADEIWEGGPLAVELAGDATCLDVLRVEVRSAAAAIAAHVEVLGTLADHDEPTTIALDVDAVERFLDDAPPILARLGIELIGPEELVRAGVDLRGVVTPAPSDRVAGFSREAVVDWRLVVADDDGPATPSAAELARAETAGATLLHTGRRWVRLDPAALQRARARLDDHHRRHVRLDPVALLQLAGDGELEAGPTTGAWTDELLNGLPDDRLDEAREDTTFDGALRPYQRRGLGWLQFLERLGLGACLADDMGLGKTPTTLAHLLTRPGRHLVVCPLSVVHNWVAEAARFTPKQRVVVHHGAGRAGADENVDELLDADLIITTYGLLARDVDHLKTLDWSTLVLDEAQMIKNPSTRAARAVRSLRADQKLALTGTPVENRLADLWAILDAVNPGLLGSREQFRQRYGRPIERHGDTDAADRLRRLTQPFVLRRTKADRQLVPDLPDKIEQIAWAGLTREQAALYQRVVDQLLADAEAATGMKRRGIVLAALTRLKQICNHPAHALADGSRLAGRSGKLARFDELVDELLDVDERALVFTQFREMGELLRRHAGERLALRLPFLHGGTSRTRREEMVAEFQAGLGPPLLLVSLKAGGTGLNLTAASQVIHYDRWWNPAVEDQATDRAWRIGQGRTVVVHKLVCEGTVEERIATLLDDKRALADAVVGSGEAWLSELSTAELRALVRLEGAP